MPSNTFTDNLQHALASERQHQTAQILYASHLSIWVFLYLQMSTPALLLLLLQHKHFAADVCERASSHPISPTVSRTHTHTAWCKPWLLCPYSGGPLTTLCRKQLSSSAQTLLPSAIRHPNRKRDAIKIIIAILSIALLRAVLRCPLLPAHCIWTVYAAGARGRCAPILPYCLLFLLYCNNSLRQAIKCCSCFQLLLLLTPLRSPLLLLRAVA